MVLVSTFSRFWLKSEMGHFSCNYVSYIFYFTALDGSIDDQPISAGLPSFIIQEEFDRYTGYWWQPTQSGMIYNEGQGSKVEVTFILDPLTTT